MKIVAIIEARMSSSRLPGKVLMEAAKKPMLEHLVNRLKFVASLDEIIIATTINKSDDILENFSKNMNISCYRGSENDVMSRVIEAADSVCTDIVVGITGDCPVIDPQLIEQTIQLFKINNADYVANAHVRTYPDGMDTQVYKLDILKQSAAMTNDKLDREHVTLHIRNNPDLFSHLYLPAPPECFWPELGLTLDEQEDYELLKKIIEHFNPINPLFSCLDIVRLLNKNPDWIKLNENVQRKGDA